MGNCVSRPRFDSGHKITEIRVFNGGQLSPIATFYFDEMKTPEIRLPLTRRQSELSRLLAQGLPRKVIADKMGISVYTVAAHLEIIRAKTGTNSINETRCFFARLYN